MKAHDKAALELAMSRCKAEGAGRAEQIESMLNGTHYADKSFGKWADPPRPWAEVAQFAAYCAQFIALRLRPWERPPCHSSGEGDDAAAVLLRRMLKAGISRWHPDPMAALEAAK